MSGQNPNAAVMLGVDSAKISGACSPVAGSSVNPAGSPAGSRTDMVRVSAAGRGPATEFCVNAPAGGGRAGVALGAAPCLDG